MPVPLLLFAGVVALWPLAAVMRRSRVRRAALVTTQPVAVVPRR